MSWRWPTMEIEKRWRKTTQMPRGADGFDGAVAGAQILASWQWAFNSVKRYDLHMYMWYRFYNLYIYIIDYYYYYFICNLRFKKESPDKPK